MDVPTLSANAMIITELMKDRVRLACAEAYEIHEEAMRAAVRVAVSPSQAIIAKTAVKKHALTLVPLCSAVEITSTIRVRTQGAVDFGPVSLTEPGTGMPMRAYLFPPRMKLENSANFSAVPYWVVETTPDLAQGNMIADTVKIHVDVFGNGVTPTKHTFSVPVLVNAVALKAGESLKLYKPREKRDHDTADLAAPRKAARHIPKGKGKKHQ